MDGGFSQWILFCWPVFSAFSIPLVPLLHVVLWDHLHVKWDRLHVKADAEISLDV